MYYKKDKSYYNIYFYQVRDMTYFYCILLISFIVEKF